jgi:hypothetical protein
MIKRMINRLGQRLAADEPCRAEHKISNLVVYPQGDDRSAEVPPNAPKPLRRTYRSTAGR